MRKFLLAAALLLAFPATAIAAPASEAERTARRTAFRTFAIPFVGDWTAEIEEWDGKAAKPVWSDRQRRIFALTMTRNFLEERAIQKTPDGRDYEAGLHLTTYDPHSDNIVQHGFWLPRQPEPLFRLDGKIAGSGFAGQMRIKNEDGSESARPLVMRWTDSDTWLIEVTDKRADGSVYVRERVTYKRAKPAAG